LCWFLIGIADPHPGLSGGSPYIKVELNQLIDAEFVIVSKSSSYQLYRRDLRSARQLQHRCDKLLQNIFFAVKAGIHLRTRSLLFFVIFCRANYFVAEVFGHVKPEQNAQHHVCQTA